uniref:Uncharacterized protein n=1 Tax=Anguilla anguilla TaxID=7936 RepID=A0A0E9R569_ANGAN
MWIINDQFSEQTGCTVL